MSWARNKTIMYPFDIISTLCAYFVFKIMNLSLEKKTYKNLDPDRQLVSYEASYQDTFIIIKLHWKYVHKL